MMATPDQMKLTAARLRRMSENLPQTVGTVLREHGAKIETKAAYLTPRVTGMLLANNRSEVDVTGTTASLIVFNNMEYAAYQHERILHHTKPGTRDHYIKIPFEAAIIGIVADVKHAIMEAATQ